MAETSGRPASEAIEPALLNEVATRWAVERIIDSYTLCMVGAGGQEYVEACADDVLAEVLGWPVRYDTVSSRGVLDIPTAQ